MDPQRNDNGDENDNDDDENIPCKVCGTPAVFRCSICQSVWYCGKDHQKQDWKDHKVTCKKWVEVKDETYGIHFLANGNLKSGVRLFQRHPILAYPKRIEEHEIKSLHPFLTSFKQALSAPISPCLGCFQPLPYKAIVFEPLDRGTLLNCCSRCEWPIHNSKCQQKHEEECKIFVKNKLLWPTFERVENIYYFIAVLRAVLLKKKSSKDWKTLRKMPYKTGMRPIIYSDPDHEREARECFNENMKFLKHFILQGCKLADTISENEIEILYRIIRSNGFLCNDSLHLKSKFCFIVYDGPQGRVLPNSCIPNCHAYVDPETLVVTFKTILPVVSGEVLTIDYQDLFCEQGQYKGLAMYSRLMFHQIDLWCDPCTCIRCSDPTENGTMFSAVSCPKKGCKGYLLPNDTTTIKQDSIWSCNVTKCGTVKSLYEVENEIVILAARELGRVRLTGSHQVIRETIRSWTKRFHPNHYKIFVALLLEIVCPASNQICSALTYLSQNRRILPDKFVFHREYLEDCQYILTLQNQLTPGRTSRRGYFEFVVCLLLISKLAEEIESQTKTMLTDFLISQVVELEKIYKHVDDCIDLMNEDPMRESGVIPGYRRTFNVHINYLNTVVSALCPDMTTLPVIYSNKVLEI